MQQHISAAGRTDREERADNGIGCECGLQYVAFKPTIKNGSSCGSEKFDCLRQFTAQLTHRFIERPKLFTVAKSFAQADAPPIIRKWKGIRCSLAEDWLKH